MPDAQVSVCIPGVIDRALLESKTHYVPLHEIQKLSLYALNIWKIDHLWMFQSLTVLRLNGNSIEKLENLEELICLRELNVSHNKITRIEGINMLTKLETLLLHHNCISCIENLENLNELCLFAVGFNQIASRDDIVYLRRVKSLKALALESNPVCTIPGHAAFVATVLPNLRYLDHKLLQKPPQLSMELRSLLGRVEDCEKAEAEAFSASQSKKQRLQLLRDAFVDELEVEDLVDVSGPHWAAILEIGGETVLSMLKEHREQMRKVCTTLQQLGLDRRKQRCTEEHQFRVCWQRACDINRNNAIRCVEAFLDPKENIYRTVRRLLREAEKKRVAGDNGTGELEAARETAERLARDTEQLSSALFELELELQEQLEETATNFGSRMTNQVDALISEARSLLLNARDLEEQFHARLEEPCYLRVANLRLQGNSTEADKLTSLSTRASQLLSEDELLGSWLREIHEERLLRITEREKRLELDTSTWLKDITNQISIEAFDRSRLRILEILNFIEMQKKEVSDLQPTSLAYTGLL